MFIQNSDHLWPAPSGSDPAMENGMNRELALYGPNDMNSTWFDQFITLVIGHYDLQYNMSIQDYFCW